MLWVYIFSSFQFNFISFFIFSRQYASSNITASVISYTCPTKVPFCTCAVCAWTAGGLGWGQSINVPWHNGRSSEPTVNISPRLLSHGEHEVSYYRHAIGFPQDAVKMPKGKREEGGQLGSRGGVYFFFKPITIILFFFFFFLVKPVNTFPNYAIWQACTTKWSRGIVSRLVRRPPTPLLDLGRLSIYSNKMLSRLISGKIPSRNLYRRQRA